MCIKEIKNSVYAVLENLYSRIYDKKGSIYNVVDIKNLIAIELLKPCYFPINSDSTHKKYVIRCKSINIRALNSIL